MKFMRYWFRLNLFVLCAGISSGQWSTPGVSLKTERPASRSTGLERLSGSAWRRLDPAESRLLLVFESVPGQSEIAALRARGARVLQFLPERGLLSAVPENFPFEEFALEWFGRLAPEQKISPLLVQGGFLVAPASDTVEQSILVEFHPDLSRAQIATILAEEQLTSVAHPNLVAWQALVKGPAFRLAKLALWEEVAYLFPASQDIAHRDPVEACRGAVTALGAIGQLTASVGSGWDGEGKGSAELNYVFASYTGRLTQDQVRSEIIRALREWASVVQIGFSPGSSAEGSRTIAIRFAAGEHNDGYPFDGVGKTLAHTFFPAPPNPEPIAGDLHLDDDEPWQTANSIDLFSVVLHELGHALGLAHSDNPSAVMYPYYRRVGALAAEDIASIRELYATYSGTPNVRTPSTPTTPTPPTTPTTPTAPVSPLQLSITQPSAVNTTTTAAAFSLNGATTGGSDIGQVVWSNHRGGSGVASGFRTWSVAAIPLQTGENILTLIATDNAQGRNSHQIRVVRESTPTPVSLFVRIANPLPGGVYETSSPSVTLSGSAGPEGAVQRIVWVSNRGSGGSTAGSAAWSTSPVQLDTGVNRLTVTATGAAGASAVATLDVQYTPPAPTPTPAIDTVAPTLVVTAPVLSTFSTPSAVVTFTGTASDNVGVSEVNWLNASGQTGRAVGTTAWRIDYALQPGINTIILRAFDAAGNSSWRSFTITRQ